MRLVTLYQEWVSYLYECELAGTDVLIGDSHLAILIYPPLTSEYIVDTGGDLFPLVVVTMSTRTHTYTYVKRDWSGSEMDKMLAHTHTYSLHTRTYTRT